VNQPKKEIREKLQKSIKTQIKKKIISKVIQMEDLDGLKRIVDKNTLKISMQNSSRGNTIELVDVEGRKIRIIKTLQIEKLVESFYEEEEISGTNINKDTQLKNEEQGTQQVLKGTQQVLQGTRVPQKQRPFVILFKNLYLSFDYSNLK